MTEELPAFIPPGDVLGGKYRLVRLIGQGAMGRVYEAQHAIVGRRFAVKILQAELAREPALLERFHREARAAGALESENLASVVDFGHTPDGLPYIVMELLLGEDLSKLIEREGPLPVPRVVSLGVQTCRGLAAAHNAGIVHRDLKPANLFVTRRGDGSDLVKILDFGIAKLDSAVESRLLNLTRTGATMGTPLYMSPEQARGEKELDQRADIYATAVILYEALSGQMPHQGDSYNALLHDILTQPAPPLASLRPGIPAAVADAIHAALSPNREERPQSAMEFARAISGYADVTPLHLRRSPTAVMPAATTMLLQTDPQPAVAATARSASSQEVQGTRPGFLSDRRLWGLGVGVAVSLVALLVVVATSRTHHAPPALPVHAVPVGPPPVPSAARETTSSDGPPSTNEAETTQETAAHDSDDKSPAPPPARHKPAPRHTAQRRAVKPKFDDVNPYQ